MKFFKATVLVVLGLFVCALQSQAENKTLEFNVNGLKVILKQTQKETIVMSMYFRGGLSNYPAKTRALSRWHSRPQLVAAPKPSVQIK